MHSSFQDWSQKLNKFIYFYNLQFFKSWINTSANFRNDMRQVLETNIYISSLKNISSGYWLSTWLSTDFKYFSFNLYFLRCCSSPLWWYVNYVWTEECSHDVHLYNNRQSPRSSLTFGLVTMVARYRRSVVAPQHLASAPPHHNCGGGAPRRLQTGAGRRGVSRYRGWEGFIVVWSEPGQMLGVGTDTRTIRWELCV